MVYSFPRATWTYYHKVDGRKHQEFFSPRARGQKFKVSLSAGLCSLCRLQRASFLLPASGGPKCSLAVVAKRQSLPLSTLPQPSSPCLLLSLRGWQSLNQEVTLIPVSYHLEILNYICKDLILKSGQILRFWMGKEFWGLLFNPPQMTSI